MLVRLTRGGHLYNKVGYSFVTRGKGMGEDHLLPPSWVDASSSLLVGGVLSLHGQARTFMTLWKNYFISQYSEGVSLWNVTFPLMCFVCIDSMPWGLINLLSSLGRTWVSGHCGFIVWGHVLCFWSMVLLLSKPTWFCACANLLSWVILNLQGSPILFSIYNPLLQLTPWRRRWQPTPVF